MSENVIPRMTDPLSLFWNQPDPQRFLIDDEVALMSKDDFYLLLEYSASTPSGVYEGKCWKAQLRGIWYLRWYGKDDGDPRGLPTPTRRIIIV
jgi:hypothetical protein